MTDRLRLHATAIAIDGRGILIIGSAGSGKSSLALQLLGMGFTLIADDQTDLTRRDDMLWAAPPISIRGMIEARGIGLLNAETTQAAIEFVIDLDHHERDRLPELHEVTFLGVTRPCLYKVDTVAWPAAILQYLKGGRREPQ